MCSWLVHNKIEVFKINIPMIELNHWDIYFKSAYDFLFPFTFLLNTLTMCFCSVKRRFRHRKA